MESTLVLRDMAKVVLRSVRMMMSPSVVMLEIKFQSKDARRALEI